MKLKIDEGAKNITQPHNAGKLGSHVSGQIIGGSAAFRGQFPWQVYIVIDNNYLCGGSLILTEWILTAAHCVYNRNNFVVTLGAIDRKVNLAGSITMSTNSKFVHENYKTSNLNNDIAMLKLPSAVTTNDFIQVAKLPETTDGIKTFEGVTVTTSGFGKTADGSSSSQYLNYVDLEVISNVACLQYYRSDIVISSTLCTKSGTSKSTCSGDSGGPLVYKENDVYKLIGIVSFGPSSGCLSGPSGFVRVASFLQWMSSKIGKDISAEVTVTMPITFSDTVMSTTLMAEMNSTESHINTFHNNTFNFGNANIFQLRNTFELINTHTFGLINININTLRIRNANIFKHRNTKNVELFTTNTFKL
ncbi:brachyurin-like [Neocloeon triangulifer]|uniref:brachyurin-like n=1 Tax=Neocloeon triangulifer TaxID=2078957 RepID=UPI00286FACBC|nr:brachyurin-like [Neocloeon triangulifer]